MSWVGHQYSRIRARRSEVNVPLSFKGNLHLLDEDGVLKYSIHEVHKTFYGSCSLYLQTEIELISRIQ